MQPVHRAWSRCGSNWCRLSLLQSEPAGTCQHIRADSRPDELVRLGGGTGRRSVGYRFGSRWSRGSNPRHPNLFGCSSVAEHRKRPVGVPISVPLPSLIVRRSCRRHGSNLYRLSPVKRVVASSSLAAGFGWCSSVGRAPKTAGRYQYIRAVGRVGGQRGAGRSPVGYLTENAGSNPVGPVLGAARRPIG